LKINKLIFISARKNLRAERNDFTEGCKILLYRSKNNFVEILKIMSNAAKDFDILSYSTDLSVLHNYFDISTKLFF